MTKELDFTGLAQFLLGKSRELIGSWLPAGKLKGKEYVLGNIGGSQGKSLSINVDTGMWADFAGNDSGGDLISLYAAINNIGQGEAARRLADDFKYDLGRDAPAKRQEAPSMVKSIPPEIASDIPDMEKPSLGVLSGYWTYKDDTGYPMFYVARYDSGDKKSFLPWSYIGNNQWAMKAWPPPRPLYGLELLAKRPNDPILICYSSDTELLTPNGWKFIKECSDSDLVAQYDYETEDVSFVVPSARQVFFYSGDMVNLAPDWGDLLVTPDHRMIVKKKQSKKRGYGYRKEVICANELTQGSLVPVAGCLEGTDDSLSVNQIRLIVAIQADGHFPKRPRGCVTFNIKKPRKLIRLKELLSSLGIGFSVIKNKSTPGWTVIQFSKSDIVFTLKYLTEKKFNRCLLSLSAPLRTVFIRELGCWDGDFVGSYGIRYFTSDRINAEIVSEMCAISCKGSILREQNRPYRENHQTEYIVNINSKAWRSFIKRSIKSVSYDGLVYCCTVPKGFLLTRRNGKTTIAGNCEGEKTTDAARIMCGKYYVCICWSGGSKAWGKTDWKPLKGREKALILPDADNSGIEAMQGLGRSLNEKIGEIKLIDTEGMPEGWDLADAIGWDWKAFKTWAIPRAKIYPPVVIPEVVKENPSGSKTLNLNVQVGDSDPVPVVSVRQKWAKYGLALTDSLIPVCNLSNAVKILRNDERSQNTIWFDEFHQRFFWKPTNGKKIEWREVDTLNLTTYIQEEVGIRRISDDLVHKAVVSYGYEKLRNEPLEWLEGLVWDKRKRIDRFFVNFMGVEESEYTTCASKNFWISMVARILRPGCKVDNMIILEGKQGRFKSMALHAIGGRFYTEAHESVMNKDFYMILQGKFIIEISELDAFSRAESNTIKKVVTNQTDRFRVPYGRTAQDFPRQCIFVGTTNEKLYLRDTTGGRRFWPISIGVINVNKILDSRNNLFAEAVYRFKAGENWYNMPEDLTEKMQESRRQHDEWEDTVQEYVRGKDVVTLKDIALKALNIEVAKLDVGIQRRIGRILTSFWYVKKNVRSNGYMTKCWVKVDPPEEVW